MIVYSVENKKNEDFSISLYNNEKHKFIIPFTSIIKNKRSEDIYNGFEEIPFKDRHPIYKTLLKLEFEDAIKAWNCSNF